MEDLLNSVSSPTSAVRAPTNNRTQSAQPCGTRRRRNGLSTFRQPGQRSQVTHVLRVAQTPAVLSVQRPTAAPSRPLEVFPIQRPMIPPSRRPPPAQQAIPRFQQTVNRYIRDKRLKVYVQNLPPCFGTLDVYHTLQQYGDIVSIDIREPLSAASTKAWVTFSPPPEHVEWIETGLQLTSRTRREQRRVAFECCEIKLREHRGLRDASRVFAETIRSTPSRLEIGIMQKEDTMMVMHNVSGTTSRSLELSVDTWHKCLEIAFTEAIHQHSPSETDALDGASSHKLRFDFALLEQVLQHDDMSTGGTTLVFSTKLPPLLFEKFRDIEATHDRELQRWSEKRAWFRQTSIAGDFRSRRMSPTTLHNADAKVDVGRWLTYRLTFDRSSSQSDDFREMCDALQHHNIPISTSTMVKRVDPEPELLWNRLYGSTAVLGEAEASSALSELHDMSQAVNLPFETLYQLEVCLSQGLLQACNIGEGFLGKLAALASHEASDNGSALRLATRLLEKVTDKQERLFNPDHVFRLLPRVSASQRSKPVYCATIRSAIVTPSTIYFMSPVLETSNRVIRRFRHYEDRFLRVKFTDERYVGKVKSSGDMSMDEVFSRVKRTMTDGIRVGGRHYDFLAFGNSQFREHGAYFFASTSDTTAQHIRDWMGTFTHIKVIAKYCSRIGQCFSTTRAMNMHVNIERLADIERNGFCFTDGVGMISPFLAQMIAQEYGLPNSAEDFPSVFQFRLAGCKGLLAVEPSLKGHTIKIRPSQEKFSAMQHRGLEICRISQFSASYLNIQIIMVLSALGVEDKVFLDRAKEMLSDLSEAMHDQQKAMMLLQKNIDFNHMTVELANMVAMGFMQSQDPFMMSCLRLWRSWSIKYLKEKAKIYVEKGAFVLGCVDETAILKGHIVASSDPVEGNVDLAALPEIFLQIPDTTNNAKWKVVEGICTLARNPSLHAGDVRVVRAVDVPRLRHLRNCVVLPQTGDRDLASMCSGGDLDGDDYLVMWDEDLLPKEWNYPPMDYTPPPPVISEGTVTVDDMTNFAVTHMKYDNLALIATGHRYWADRLDEGVKSEICRELCQLHSTAVDFAKSGIPAVLPDRLKVRSWPHWSGKGGRVYQSKKIIGQLYDLVDKLPSAPAWDLPFDERITGAFDDKILPLEAAREVKRQYDEAIRRVMAKYSIKSEFEVWTTFALDHSNDTNDYKFAETLGEITNALKDTHRELCYLAAGTDKSRRDWSKMAPFITAMYVVTAEEVQGALAECRRSKIVGNEEVPVMVASMANMPFISFPWIFAQELGRIAKKTDDRSISIPGPPMPSTKVKGKTPTIGFITGDVVEPEALPYVTVPEGNVYGGDLLDLYSLDAGPSDIGQRALTTDRNEPSNADAHGIDLKSGMPLVQNSSPGHLDAGAYQVEESDVKQTLAASQEVGNGMSSAEVVPEQVTTSATIRKQAVIEDEGERATDVVNEEVDEEDVETEEVVLTLDTGPSALDAFERLMER